jgi:hypothetical protein
MQDFIEKCRREETARNAEMEMGDNIKIDPKENGCEV